MTMELDRREGHGKTGHAWFQTDPPGTKTHVQAVIGISKKL